jgi:hypothetical protein
LSDDAQNGRHEGELCTPKRKGGSYQFMENAFEAETEVDKIKKLLSVIGFTNDDLAVHNGSVLLTASGFSRSVMKASEIKKAGLQVYQSTAATVWPASVGFAQKKTRKRKS